jgi:hypothetical protein
MRAEHVLLPVFPDTAGLSLSIGSFISYQPKAIVGIFGYVSAGEWFDDG